MPWRTQRRDVCRTEWLDVPTERRWRGIIHLDLIQRDVLSRLRVGRGGRSRLVRQIRCLLDSGVPTRRERWAG